MSCVCQNISVDVTFAFTHLLIVCHVDIMCRVVDVSVRTCARVLAAGARVYGVETVSQRLAQGGLGLLGPEATYTRHGLTDSSRVLYLHYIR